MPALPMKKEKNSLRFWTQAYRYFRYFIRIKQRFTLGGLTDLKPEKKMQVEN